jgi:hypothetical protein
MKFVSKNKVLQMEKCLNNPVSIYLKRLTYLSFLTCVFVGITFNSSAKNIGIVTRSTLLKPQAEILEYYLDSMYKSDSFAILNEMPVSGNAIVLKSDLDLEPEEFSIISKTNENGQIILTIAAGHPSGMYYGICQFLEELGCGFFLSFETIPEKIGEIELRGFQVSEKPLVKDRFVFNWHNFLSGCSSWDFEEWKQYIDQSSKMRFNGLMTHFYANDPSFVFSYNGIEKKVGFMPNTSKGRQYGTQQVNDVRRMVAGNVFDDAVFGSQTSKVPDNVRVEESRTLIQNIHKYAKSKFMDVWFGYDVDYELANPQEIMTTLPDDAKIKIKRKPDKYFGMPDSVFYLPVPDSPEGFAYYKSQVSQLFMQFPNIDNLVLWTRTSGSAFLTLRYNEFPENWKKEFDKIADSNPEIDKTDENITGRFATSKIYKTIRKCLDEIDKTEIKLWAGSWRTSWLEQADWFYPKEVGFIPLDYNVDYFTVEEKHQILKNISKNRELLPVVWAHHDDGAFIGSTYVPYENLQSKVESVGNTGLGVIHWTTKPLDIYFKNTEQQLWQRTKNASLKNTANLMAARMVTSDNAEKMSEYLQKWVTEGPKFGRETSPRFIDHLISKEDFDNVLKGCKKRILILESIQEPDNKQVQYFKLLEEFCIDFYVAQFNYQEALRECNSGNFLPAQNFIKNCHPEEVIEKYANASSKNSLTKGEKGVIVELNLSWLPLINSLKQTLREKPVLYNFGEVNFPDMGVGLLNTNYFIDSDKNLWRNFGESETGGEYFANNNVKIEADNHALAEICTQGICANDSLVIEIKPFAVDISPAVLKNPDYFMPGKYLLTLIFNEHEFTKRGKREFRIQISDDKNQINPISEPIDIFAQTDKKNKVLIKTYSIEFHEKNSLKLILKNSKNRAIINGIKLEPLLL